MKREDFIYKDTFVCFGLAYIPVRSGLKRLAERA